MRDDELSEQDITPLIQALKQRDAVYRQRNEKRYDGVLGRLPQWVPEWHQKQFEVTRNRLLDSGAFNKPLSPQTVRGYMKMYMHLGVNRDSTVSKPGEQTDGPEWIPPEVMEDVAYLAHLRWAISLGEERGLQELSGKMAVRGGAHAKGYSKGGRASKKKAGIWAAVQELVKEDPTITAGKAWLSFPDARTITLRLRYTDPVTRFVVYLDDNKLVQLDDKTGRETAITYRTFQRYVTAAKRSK